MALTQKEIEHIALLARLDLSNEEKEKCANELSAILDYIDQLQEVNTSGVSYEYQVEGLVNVLDHDEVVVCDEDTRMRILAAMPDRAGDLLRVKGIFS